jgi:hypothetical protein
MRPVLASTLNDIFRSSLSARMQVMYILPGTDRLNAAQGPEFSLWFPSPAKNGHWFYRETLGVYEFHQTAVPGNSGDQNRGRTAFLSFGVVYRWKHGASLANLFDPSWSRNQLNK